MDYLQPILSFVASDKGIQTILSLIGGGISGALVGASFARRKERREIGLKLVDYYFSSYAEVAEAAGLLERPASLTDPKRLNQVLAIGNWFDFTAALYEKKIADQRLLRLIGVDEQIREFRRRAQAAKSPELTAALKQWTHLVGFDGGEAS